MLQGEYDIKRQKVVRLLMMSTKCYTMDAYRQHHLKKFKSADDYAM